VRKGTRLSLSLTVCRRRRTGGGRAWERGYISVQARACLTGQSSVKHVTHDMNIKQLDSSLAEV